MIKLFLVLILIGLVGGLVFFEKQKSSKPVQSSPNTVVPKQTDTGLIPPFVPSSINCKQTPQFCSSAQFGIFPTKEEWVYAKAKEIAIQKNDVSYCDLTIGRNFGDYTVSKEQSRDDCKSEFSIETENLSYCMTLDEKPTYSGSTSSRDFCLKGLAKKLKRVDLCDLLYSAKDKDYGKNSLDACKRDVNL